MSAGSTLDPDAGTGPGSLRPPGHDVGSLGPSDLSDTGSDTVGPGGYDPAILGDDGDSVGTGVDPAPYEANDGDTGSDVGFDRVVGADEAGLGGGLDQAEEASYGVTDEELDPVDEAGASLAPVGARTRDRAGEGDADRGDARGGGVNDGYTARPDLRSGVDVVRDDDVQADASGDGDEDGLQDVR
jgi:hypothetical protein